MRIMDLTRTTNDVSGPASQRFARALPAHNVGRGEFATVLHVMLAGVTMVAAIWLSITGARTFAATPQDPGMQRAPAVEQVRAAHAAARGWLDRFETPSLTAPESHVPIERARAVCVILRRHGRAMGVGIDAAGDDLMLRRAAGRAMNQALADPALQALAAGLRRGEQADDAGDDNGNGDGNGAPDADPAHTQPEPPRLDPEAEARIESLRQDLGRSLTLELEVAGELIPLAGRTLQQMAGKIEIGVDGLAIRREQQWAYQFPSHMRVANTLDEPEDMLRNLGISAGVAMNELAGEIGARGDTSFYRFRSVNLAQTAPDGAAVELFRGDVLVKPDDVTRERIAQLADGIAQHMLANLWPDPPAPPQGQPPLPRLPMGARGDYSPAADQHQPDFAPPMEQALCAWALVRYTTCVDVDRVQRATAGDAARQLLRDLAEVHPRERDPRDDPGACAVLLYIAADTPSMLGDANVGALMRTAAERVFRSFDGGHVAHGDDVENRRAQGAERARGFQWLVRAEGGGVAGQTVSPLSQAMLAGAMARILSGNVRELTLADRATCLAAAETAWNAVDDSGRVALLPWIGWAFDDLAKKTTDPVSHADELQTLIHMLDRARVTCDAEGADGCAPDLDGGFALTGARGDESPISAQSLRPALWLATTFNDRSSLKQTTRGDAWPGHLRTMRFLMQLAVSDMQGAMVRNRDRTDGGVCASLWDSRQPVAAQALGLLAAAETLRAQPW